MLNFIRAIGRAENPGELVVMGGENMPTLVEIGWIDLPKIGGAKAPPAPLLATGLFMLGEILNCACKSNEHWLVLGFLSYKYQKLTKLIYKGHLILK